MRKFEIILFTVPFLAILYKSIISPFAIGLSELIIIPWGILGLSYLFLGFYIPNNLKLRKFDRGEYGLSLIIISITSGIALFSSLWSMISRFSMFPGALQVAIGSLVAICFLLAIVQISIRRKRYIDDTPMRNLSKRLLLMLTGVILTISLNSHSINHLYYGQFPELVKLYDERTRIDNGESDADYNEISYKLQELREQISQGYDSPTVSNEANSEVFVHYFTNGDTLSIERYEYYDTIRNIAVRDEVDTFIINGPIVKKYQHYFPKADINFLREYLVDGTVVNHSGDIVFMIQMGQPTFSINNPTDIRIYAANPPHSSNTLYVDIFKNGELIVSDTLKPLEDVGGIFFNKPLPKPGLYKFRGILETSEYFVDHVVRDTIWHDLVVEGTEI